MHVSYIMLFTLCIDHIKIVILFIFIYQLSERKIWLLDWGMLVVGWTGWRKHFLPCTTPPTFSKGYWPNFHRSLVIKGPDAYFQCIVIWAFFCGIFISWKLGFVTLLCSCFALLWSNGLITLLTDHWVSQFWFMLI